MLRNSQVMRPSTLLVDEDRHHDRAVGERSPLGDRNWPISDARASHPDVHCAHIARAQSADPTVAYAVDLDVGPRRLLVDTPLADASLVLQQERVPTPT